MTDTNVVSDDRVSAARAAVAQFEQRFPDWEELNEAYGNTIARKVCEAIERLIKKRFTALAQPALASAKATKLTFRSPDARRQFILKRLALEEEEVFNVSVCPPCDYARLPYLTLDDADCFMEYPDPKFEAPESASVVKRALTIGVSFTDIIKSVQRSHRTTKGTRRFQAARGHWDVIQAALAMIDAAEAVPERLGSVFTIRSRLANLRKGTPIILK